MVSRWVFGILLGALVAFAASGQNVSTFSIRTPGTAVSEADNAFREAVVAATEQAAESLGVVLDTSDIVIVSRDDVVVVCAGAASFGESGDGLPVGLIDIGLIYTSREVDVRFGDGEHGTLPSGFHAVRVQAAATRGAHDPGIALLELTGDPSATEASQPFELVSPVSVRTLAAGLEVDSDTGEVCLVFGWYGPQFGVELRAVLRADG